MDYSIGSRILVVLLALNSGCARMQKPGALRLEVKPDRDAATKATSRYYDSFTSECAADMDPVPEALFEDDNSGAAGVRFHEGAERALGALNERRVEDSRVEPVAAMSEALDGAGAGGLRQLNIDAEGGLVTGVWTPRHHEPPPFKIYQFALDAPGGADVRAATRPGFVFIDQRREDGVDRLLLGPYCFRRLSAAR